MENIHISEDIRRSFSLVYQPFTINFFFLLFFFFLQKHF